MKKKINSNLDGLYEAFLTLETKEECKAFLNDVFTINELLEASQRLDVAKMLKQDKVYNDIVKETGASTATISRVNRCINYGDGGYDIVIERLENK